MSQQAKERLESELPGTEVTLHPVVSEGVGKVYKIAINGEVWYRAARNSNVRRDFDARAAAAPRDRAARARRWTEPESSDVRPRRPGPPADSRAGTT